MKVFFAAASLLPSYGGPAFSVSRLATALSEAGAEVGLWAADQSAPSTQMLPKNSSVTRLSDTEAEALDSFGTPDVLHDNGIWLPHNHRLAVIAQKRGIPRVVTLRGMLEPWALRHKRWKKSLAWVAYQRRDLQQACCHIVTGEPEARNLQKLGLRVPVVTVPNGVDVPELTSAERANSDSSNRDRTRTALFLGRIYPVKGLPMLVEAWSRVRPQGWMLKIAGPDEAGHRRQVERAVSAARLGDVVSFLGPIEPMRKQSTFLDADLFLLPTHSESFGVVIAEALAHGLPVLTTTGAPWPMLPENGCGWWVDATVDGLTEGLRQATILDRKTLQAMGARGRELVIANFAWKRIANLILSTYSPILKGARTETEMSTAAS